MGLKVMDCHASLAMTGEFFVIARHEAIHGFKRHGLPRFARNDGFWIATLRSQ
jgi:hypothetical protein